MLTPVFWKNYFHVYDTLNELIPYQELLLSIASKVPKQRDITIFDAGCGTGNLLRVLSKQAYTQLTGLDLSPVGIEIAKSKVPNAKLSIGDIKKPLPYADTSFDALVTNNTIYTIPVALRPGLFKEFFRILKPGGTIIVSNIAVNFRPNQIYLHHIKNEIAQKGFIKTIVHAIRLLIPTLRIFYYNIRIRHANTAGEYSFLTEEKQRSLLTTAGFQVLSEERAYAGNAVITKALKPS